MHSSLYTTATTLFIALFLRIEQYFTLYTYRPGSQEIDQEVATKTCRKHLRNDVQIGDQGRLQDDGNVGGVEQFDGVGVVLTPVAC